MLNKIIPKSESSKNVIILMTGTIISQILPIAIAPLLTRIYSPEDMGVFALYVSLCAILSLLSTGRYELSILLPKTESHAKCLLQLSIFTCAVFSLIVLIVIVFFYEKIVNLTGGDKLGNSIYILPFSIFFGGCYQSYSYFYNRRKEYRKIAKSRIVQNSTMSIGQMAFYFLKEVGLITGHFLGQFLGLISLARSNGIDVFCNISFTKIKVLAKKHVKFPKFLLLAHGLNTLSSQNAILLLNLFFSSSVAGFYMLTQRVISAPISILAQAIGDVFRQEASHKYIRDGECNDIYNRTFIKLVCISTVPFIIFFFYAPTIFGIVFGNDWFIAGQYAQILTPMFYFRFITSPLSSMFIVAEKQKNDLLWQIALFFSTLVSLYLGYHLGDINLSLMLFSFSYSIMYAINGYMTWLFSKGTNDNTKGECGE